jgi:hypothetical protein
MRGVTKKKLFFKKNFFLIIFFCKLYFLRNFNFLKKINFNYLLFFKNVTPLFFNNFFFISQIFINRHTKHKIYYNFFLAKNNLCYFDNFILDFFDFNKISYTNIFGSKLFFGLSNDIIFDKKSISLNAIASKIDVATFNSQNLDVIESDEVLSAILDNDNNDFNKLSDQPSNLNSDDDDNDAVTLTNIHANILESHFFNTFFVED